MQRIGFKENLMLISSKLKSAINDLHDTGEHESENLDKALIEIEKGYKKIEYEIYNLDRRQLQNPYAHIEEINNG